MSKRWGAEVWLKREDLAHTGAHKINNAVGQTLLAKRLGAKRIIAETGAGQHGVASAAAAARLGLPCVVYMGAVDVERQAPNVGRMQLMGATVVPVTAGDKTLRAAIDEALRDWVSDPDGTYYVLGSAVGPHPYPYLVRELQSVIGREARAQMLAQREGLPDVAVACVGGGSNAIGLFHPFLGDAAVQLLGVEAGGRGPGLGDNAAPLTFGTPGVLQGSYTLILQDAFGQVRETHSVSAGLDYSGVGPEHAFLMSSGRVSYESATDEEALDALSECAKCEGILAGHRNRPRHLRRAPLCRVASRIAHPHRLLGSRRQGHEHLAAHGARDKAQMRPREHHIRRDQRRDRRRTAGAGGISYRRISDPPRHFERISPPSPRRATWSRSAFPSPIRWPTARPFSAQASSRSPRASRCRGFSRSSAHCRRRPRRRFC